MTPWDFVCWAMAVAASVAILGMGVGLGMLCALGLECGHVFKAMAHRVAGWIHGGRR